MEKHVYSPLRSDEHVRVLVLHPSDTPSKPLLCSIQQLEIEGGVNKYECISYTWGTPEPSHTLRCDDHSVFRITENLHSALVRFRSKTRTRYIWADAVCINQADLKEKSQQIPLMARIYRNASRVLVWLGNGSGGEGQTMNSLASLTRSSYSFQNNPGEFIAAGDKVLQHFWAKSDSVRHFFEMPWFSRRWVIQEVVLNPDVVFYCGPSTKISWPRLLLAIEILSKSTWDKKFERKALTSLRRLGDLWRTWSLLDEPKEDCELLDLLDSFHHFGCADDKDKIYALSGLATDVRASSSSPKFWADESKTTITPSYLLPTDEVYRTFAWQRIQSGKLFSTLSYAGALRSCDTDRALPSWAPDFRLPKLHSPIIREQNHVIQPTVTARYDGSIALTGNVYVLRNKPYEAANGLESNFVQHKGPVGPTVFEPHSMLQWIRDCVYFMESNAVEIVGEKERSEMKYVLGHVIVAHGDMLADLEFEMRKSLVDTTTAEDISLDGEQWAVVTQNARTLLSLLDSEGDGQDIEEIAPYLYLAYRTMSGRRLFLSNVINIFQKNGDNADSVSTHGKRSLVGIGPKDLEVGDVIVVFNSLESPLYLRPKSGGYQLLGDGYLAMLPSDVFGDGFRYFMRNGSRENVEVVLI